MIISNGAKILYFSYITTLITKSPVFLDKKILCPLYFLIFFGHIEIIL